MARPSNLGSATYSTAGSLSLRPSSRRTRASKAWAPLASVSVSVWMLSMGAAWRTGARPSITAPITRCVGESGVTRSGCPASSACRR